MKYIKLFIYTILGIIFLISVDFRDLSFKTVTPKPQNQIKINENIGAGVVKNIENFDLLTGKFFEGNEQNIVDLVNQARKKAGIEELKINEKLSLSAMEKAQHMKKNDYFEHVSPQGLNPWYFAEKQDYHYKSFGENLAEGYFSAESVHEGWMNSPGHRENVLSVNFKEIGVAILEIEKGGQRSYLAVQHFGSRLTAQDLKTEIICDKKSKKNCEEAEREEKKIKNLIKEQKNIIEEAKKNGAGDKDLNRLESNLEDLEKAKDDLEDYLEECEKFIKKCDSFE